MLDPNRTTRTLIWGTFACAMLGACSAGGSRPAPDPALASDPGVVEADRTPAQLIPGRIYAIAGRTLVIPLGSPTAIAEPVRLESGGILPTSLHRITRRPNPRATGRWLDDASLWQSEERPLGEPALDQGLWMLRVDLPESARGDGLFAGDRRLPVLWVPEPPASVDSRFVPRLDATPSAWRELGDVLAPLRDDPSQRWRVRLLTDRVRADQLFGVRDGFTGERPVADPLLEALATQTELRYRAAIARVQLADPAAAAGLLTTLTTVVSMPDGQLLPAWSDVTPRLSTIIDTALNTARPPARAAEATRSWLAALAPVRGWVIDDASRTENGRRVATFGVANLTGTSVRASVGPAGETNTALATVREVRAQDVRVPVLVDEPTIPTDPPRARPLVVRTIKPIERHALFTPGLGFNPPGMSMSPMLASWSRRSWLAQRPSPVADDRQTLALLQHAPDGDGWEIYIECRTPMPSATNSSDLARIWLGSFARSSGYLVAGPGAGAALRATEPPPFKLHDWGWSSVVRVPESVIEPDGTLHIAVERIDADGIRSTWPRPVLPNQLEPGRATVRLVPWTSFSTR